MGCDFYIVKALLVTKKDETTVPCYKLEVYREARYAHHIPSYLYREHGYTDPDDRGSDEDVNEDEDEDEMHDYILEMYKEKILDKHKSTLLFENGKWVSKCKDIELYQSMVKELGIPTKDIKTIRTVYYAEDR